jgi:hypothetical protein
LHVILLRRICLPRLTAYVGENMTLVA